ncbi:hypothetical protein V1264_004366 [Littorina saxatilis]
MGEKFKYSTKENSTLEWFSLPIPDLQELTAVARKTLGQGPVLNEPVNVEISLKTKENNAYMFLEVWSISLDTDHCDPDVKISSTVYGRMTLALKSILCVSRVAPCYRLAQRQKKDDFQIHYQYNLGPPHLALLGEDIQTKKIAAVSTPVGTIRISLSYTTNLQMPQKPKKIDLKDDHFSTPRLGQFSEPKPCNRKFRNPTSVEDLRFLDSLEKQDTFNAMFSTSPPEGISPPLPQITEMISTLKESSLCDDKQKTAEESDPFHPYFRSAVFLQGEGKAVQVERPEDRPFASLMDGLPMPGAESSDGSPSDYLEQGAQSKEKGEEGVEKTKEEGEKGEASGSDSEGEEPDSHSPSSSDFVMLPPLEFPFADTDPTTNLGQFYREMQSAPPLTMCEHQTVQLTDYLASLKGEIDKFSATQGDYEKILKSICTDEEEQSD